MVLVRSDRVVAVELRIAAINESRSIHLPIIHHPRLPVCLPIHGNSRIRPSVLVEPIPSGALADIRIGGAVKYQHQHFHITRQSHRLRWQLDDQVPDTPL